MQIDLLCFQPQIPDICFFLKLISNEDLLSGITRIFTLKCQHDEQNEVINDEHSAKSVTRQVDVNATKRIFQ